ncbi:HERC2 [Symbiodinium pilosum]|uniref:HERC2 protein n=1 Tax=Symbiodinium pilosum TaxID=2952 RepID=A0A812KID5_SYMPI|nr:HERC2 [Symbiodinium pilosum]
MRTLPAVSTFAFIALFGVVLCRAAYVDQRAQKTIPWASIEPVMLRTKPISEEDEAGAEHEPKRRCCCSQLACLKDWCLWCTGICFGVENIVQIFTELLPNAPEATVNRCIKSLHAHRSGVAKDSLAIILQPGEKFDVKESMLCVWQDRNPGRAKCEIVWAVDPWNLPKVKTAL